MVRVVGRLVLAMACPGAAAVIPVPVVLPVLLCMVAVLCVRRRAAADGGQRGDRDCVAPAHAVSSMRTSRIIPASM